TSIDGTSLYVSGGGTLALPGVTSYTNLVSYNDQYRTLQASGAGSALDLHNVTAVTNGTNYDTNLTIQALAGASVNLSGTTTLLDRPPGDKNYGAINVTADGAGSAVNLSALSSFVDNYAGSTGGGNRFSTLTATNSGAVTVAGSNALLVGVLVTLGTSG